MTHKHREFNPGKRNKIEIATTDDTYQHEKKKEKEAKRQVECLNSIGVVIVNM